MATSRLNESGVWLARINGNIRWDMHMHMRIPIRARSRSLCQVSLVLFSGSNSVVHVVTLSKNPLGADSEVGIPSNILLTFSLWLHAYVEILHGAKISRV